MKGESSKIIAENRPAWLDYLDDSHSPAEIRRCRRCGVRKVLGLGFYRDRKSRGGYRRECKKCRNLQRARWARRRYRAGSGRAAAEAQES